MNRVLVELLWSPTGETRDLDLPADVPIRELAGRIARAMGAEADEAIWMLEDAITGHPLAPEQELAALGVWHGARLVCRPVKDSTVLPTPGELVLETLAGERYRLSANPVLLGRPRAGHAAARYSLIDLSHEPGGKTVSREHALLRQLEGEWFIEHLPTASNPTLVNGKSLAIAQPVSLREGDEIQLGAVRLLLMRDRDIHT